MEKTSKGIPEAVHSPVQMNEPNEIIPIYNGTFQIKSGDRVSNIEGSIFYKWLPRYGVFFTGNLDDESMVEFLISDKWLDSEIIIDGLIFSKSQVTKLSFPYVEGYMSGKTTLGASSVNVTKINFALPNLRSINGDPVEYKLDNGHSTFDRGRLVLNNGDDYILIDKNRDFKRLSDSLYEQGGYMFLYSGEITKKNGAISYDDAVELKEMLSIFLGFINGRRCAPLIMEGKHLDEVIWTDYSKFKVDSHKYVKNWAQKFNIDGLNDIWNTFSEIWKNDDGKDFLKTAIHWYIEANSISGGIEGSIIMAQTALELIYNWLIVEKQNIIIGKDSETISAANKIRILLSHVKIEAQIPDSLEHLKKVQSENSELSDAPEVIVSIRNAIVHSNKTKREKLPKIPFMARYEACDLCLKYVELSLLFILNYKSNYFNRCSGANWEGEGIEIVPWIKGK